MAGIRSGSMSNQVPDLFKLARENLSNSGLLITEQTRRDVAVNRTLACLPKVLIDMTCAYAQEELLSCYKLNDLNQVEWDSDANKEITETILRIFSSDDPDDKLHQRALIQHHGRRILDEIITGWLEFQPNRGNLSRIREKNLAAVAMRRRCLAAATAYLPYEEVDRVLKSELRLSRQTRTAWGSLVSEDEGNLHLSNARYIFEALTKQGIRSNKESAGRSLLINQSDYLIQIANGQLKKHNYQAALESLIKPFITFCRLGEKRRAAETAVQIMENCRALPPENLPEVFKFFEVSKQLCLKYPADSDLYVELLFAMDNFAQQHADLALSRKIYQDVGPQMSSLPVELQGQLQFKIIQMDYAAGEHISMQRLTSTVEQIMLSFSPAHSRNAVNMNVNALYRMIATIATQQVYHFDSMTAQQRADYRYLIGLPRFIGEMYHFRIEGDGEGDAVPNDQLSDAEFYASLVKSIARSYQSALAVLYRGIFPEHINHACFVATFDELVHFYLRHNNLIALKSLLSRKNVRPFSGYQDFKTNLTKWRKSLSAQARKSDRVQSQSGQITPRKRAKTKSNVS